jgi:hypothetical protein
VIIICLDMLETVKLKAACVGNLFVFLDLDGGAT